MTLENTLSTASLHQIKNQNKPIYWFLRHHPLITQLRSEQFRKQNTISKKLYMDAYLIQKLKQNFRDRYEYFWAGAKISRGTLFWENGRSERISTGKYL